MTIEKYLLEYLIASGMFEIQAKQVIELARAGSPYMTGRWNDIVKGYPDIFMGTMKVVINRYALEWIDNNLPAAWYRPMFE
jgi:hypothetical protein